MYVNCMFVLIPSRIRVGVLTQGWSIHEVRPPAENDYACEDICVFQIFPAEKKRDAIFDQNGSPKLQSSAAQTCYQNLDIAELVL